MDDVILERQYGEFTARVFRGVGPGWMRCQAELVAQGVAVPLSHRVEWAECVRDQEQQWFAAILGATGMCRYGFGIGCGSSRALPGHHILRVERFRGSGCPELDAAAVAALKELAAAHPRVLRLHVAIFSMEADRRAALGQLMRGAGARQVEGSSYARTLVLDLTPGEDALLAGLHSTARRYVRAVDKHPLRVGPIEDACLAPRLSALLAESMTRTGGAAHRLDWEGLVVLSTRYPDLARLVGLFRTDRAGPEALLAFELAKAHGDHVEEALAAATRETELRFSLAVPLVWDVIRWAKSVGATWLDLGGVPEEGSDGSAPLAGITQLKRRFSKREVRVGEEWVLKPRPVRARLAEAISSGNRLLERIRPGSRAPRVSGRGGP